ncbi:hypothetical protein V6255_18885, partial [Psychromonas arctica]
IASHIESIYEDDILSDLKEYLSELLYQLDREEHSLSGAKGAFNRIRSESTKWSSIKKNGNSTLEVQYVTN